MSIVNEEVYQEISTEEREQIINKIRSDHHYDDYLESLSKEPEMEFVSKIILAGLPKQSRIEAIELLQQRADVLRRAADNLERIIEEL